MSESHEIRMLLGWVAAAGVAVIGMSLPLQPSGFVAGDQGVKLIAAKNAIAHPDRPFQIDLPTIAGRPVQFVDRFFRVHGDHAHALQSPLFPGLSAPLIAIGGLRGAYILPALSFLLMLPLAYAISRHTRIDVSVTALATSSILANPVFFYAFEFWEHVPAVAVLSASTALAVKGGTLPFTWAIVAGVLAGAAVLLRPEAVWYAMALAATLVWRRTFASYAVGLCSVLVAYAASNYIEGGSIFGYHASANLSALSDRWLGVRFERLVLWLIPPSPIFATGVGGLVVAWVDRLAGHSPARAQVIGLVAAAAIAVGAAADSYPLDSLWRAWPLGAIVLVPLSNYKGLAPFVWLSGATSLCVWLTSTHDGGAQWGPRVLLISTPAFLVLAAAAVHDTSAPGVYRHLRVAVVLVLVATGVWTTRAAYVDLRGWKRYYGTLVRSVEENTEVGSYVLTNVWWLDQICAPLYGTRTFLVAPSPPESSKALQQLQHGGVRSLYLAWSSENAETGLVPLAGSCYVIDRSLSFKERGVHLSHATCVE